MDRLIFIHKKLSIDNLDKIANKLKKSIHVYINELFLIYPP